MRESKAKPIVYRSRWALRAGVLGGALLVVALLTSSGWAGELFEFLPPHSAVRSGAVLKEPLAKELVAARQGAELPDVPALIRFTLAQTRPRLHFGLDHKTSLAFDQTEREGNCIEYSHLFAKLFDETATDAGLRASAYVVHSGRAHLLGMRIPRRGWNDHDWVLVVERDASNAEAARYFIDPSFDDSGLGWNIKPSVRGEVKLPAKR
jgi:hypothetical protein